MTKGFQKTAKKPQTVSLPHPGIIDRSSFAKYFELCCYQPSADLRPFVQHIWVQRQLVRNVPKPPVEVLSGPNIYLFFTSQTAFIHGITRQTFNYDARASRVVAGVKFRPGGFYPFLGRPVSELEDSTPTLASVFPIATEAFCQDLLKQENADIVTRLEALLRAKHPQNNKSLELVANILQTLESDSSLKTVGAIAQTFHMNERTLQLLFRTHVGAGLKRIIARRRLLEAINQVMRRPSPSQAEIAIEFGYNSQSHFTRDFKSVIGQPPSQFLKSLVG